MLEFQKTNIVFEIGTLQFLKLRNFMEKLKYLNLAQKKLYLSVLGLAFWKISTLEFVKLQNFVKKWQCLNLVPKMPYWGIFRLGFENNIFGLEFENNIVIFEISNLEFVYLQNFGKKWKCLSLGPNMPYLGIFSAGISNEYCHIWNQHPQIRLIAKIRKKMKMTKFGTKKALFGYFWVRILNLKSAPSNLSNCEILWKNENA